MNSLSKFAAASVVAVAAVGVWFVLGTGEQGANAAPGSGDAQAQLQQAADAVVAAAAERVQSASSDQEAVNRMQLSLETLRMIGMLGEFDTQGKADKLLDDLQAGAKPQLAEMIIQMRVARHVRNWGQLDVATRREVLDRFVSDVKQSGMSRGHADLVMQLSQMLENSDQGELAKELIQELLPTFAQAQSPEVQRMGSLMEGVVRRLPGNQLELEGTMLDGGEFDWSQYRGKVVLIDFFASWCGPCRAEVPNILQNYQAYRDKGFEVVGVNMDSERSAAESYIRQAGFNFPVLFSDDPEATGWDHPMGRKYGVTALPRVILVDKNGVVISTSARGPKLRALLEQQLGSPGNAVGEATVDPNVEQAGFEDAGPDVIDEEAPAAVPEG